MRESGSGGLTSLDDLFQRRLEVFAQHPLPSVPTPEQAQEALRKKADEEHEETVRISVLVIRQRVAKMSKAQLLRARMADQVPVHPGDAEVLLEVLRRLILVLTLGTVDIGNGAVAAAEQQRQANQVLAACAHLQLRKNNAAERQAERQALRDLFDQRRPGQPTLDELQAEVKATIGKHRTLKAEGDSGLQVFMADKHANGARKAYRDALAEFEALRPELLAELRDEGERPQHERPRG